MENATSSGVLARPQEIRQHNAITTARYDYSACQMDIMFLLLSQLRRDDSPDRLYTIYLRDMEERSSRQWNYHQLQEATADMGSRVFTIKEKDKVTQLWMMDKVVYVLGAGHITIELTKSIRPYLFDLIENFTSFELEAALRLTSKYAKRVYQLASQWKDKQETQTYTLDEFRYMLNLSEPEAKPKKKSTPKKGKEIAAASQSADEMPESATAQGKGKTKDTFSKLSQLKERVLDISVEQINEHTELKIDYVLLKKGRSYDRIRFTVKSKANAQPARLLVPPVEADQLPIAERHLDELGITLPGLRSQILASPDLVVRLHKFIYELKIGKVTASKNAGGLFLKMANLR